MSGEVEFDRIAPIYDETRQPPTPEELDALTDLFRGCRTVLDAGVGTGRFAGPLRSRQLDVVGVDVSLEMMSRARSKGITKLVRADVHRLPFADRSVDAAFMAHVMQLIPEPTQVLRELGRVAREAVVISLPEWFERPDGGPWRERRERYRQIAAELGYPIPARGQRYRHTLEDLSKIAPPKEVRRVARSLPAPSEGREAFGRWANGWLGGTPVPAEVHAEIVRRLLAERPIDPAALRRHRESRFVAWDPRALAHVPDGSSALA